ncbi:Os01g0936950 [Oryza sativa Japonica Group]|uniref:Os01g0936950 protein n=1 Tax=Oryza sativa subsp. japonica TaxID=39947 RepID=A0A0P0VCQ3_ORYSJ|nr:hypothetical protein EE612_007849 [Oryza sativa]BAS76110.1 Os01g0936950 [Oryza sativa Japonica Group]
MPNSSGTTRRWNGPPPKMAAPVPPPPGRHSANFLSTLSDAATCDGSDRGAPDSPATPTAPDGSDPRSAPGAQAACTGNATGYSGFTPSVTFASIGVVVTSPRAHWPLSGLYG